MKENHPMFSHPLQKTTLVTTGESKGSRTALYA
jgi:hypothetical protein